MKRSKKDNLIQTKDGKARLYALPRAKSTWRDPKTPEMDANFRVRFSVCGVSWNERASNYPVAAGITADLKEWVKLKIAARAHLIREGEKDQLRSIFQPKRMVMLSEIRPVYLGHVSPTKLDSARKNVARLEHIGTEMTGLPVERVPMTDAVWSRSALRGWVRMRQEYFRRGWSTENHQRVEAAEHERRWVTLRKDLQEGRIPGVDEDTEMEGNTTIQSYLTCAKAVFAWQRKYLEGLALPALEEFMGFSESLPGPEGHREIPVMVRQRIMSDLPRLKAEQLPLWVFFMLCYETGARPISIKRAALSDLRVVTGAEAAELRLATAREWQLEPTQVEEIGGVLRLKPTKRGAMVQRALSVGLVQAVCAQATDASLMGAASATAADKVHDATNEWLRQRGLEGTHGVYMLRHANLQQLRDAGGEKLAQAGGGHLTKQAMERYSAERRVVPLLRSQG
jgi:hypothetical protein